MSEAAQNFGNLPLRCAALTLLGVLFAVNASTSDSPDVFNWTSLPNIPDREGFAGSFGGVSGDALLIAGGANFPDKRPWEGGTKTWHEAIYVLEQPNGTWRLAGKLPLPLGYGISVSTGRGVLCVGGSNADGHHNDVFELRWDHGALETLALPALPYPLANHCGALIGRKLYIAGGIRTPAATQAEHGFLMLDLDATANGWQHLDPWPGRERMLAVAGVADNSFFLFGGAALKAGADGKPTRDWLNDAYRFSPVKGWARIAELPHPSVAAPSPAPCIGNAHLLVLGGDDGTPLDAKPHEHLGFPRDILAYHLITNTWVKRGAVPFSLVTTPVVHWRDNWIVPGGEARPGVRSNSVWSAQLETRRASFGWLNYSALGLYLLGMLAIGSWCARRNRSTADCFQASGRIPWWAAGLSIYATMLSSLTFMALPAKSYATDWTYFWANVPILLLAPLLAFVHVPFFRRLKMLSAYEYLEQRFNLTVRLYGSAAFILFQLGRQAIVLLLPALALSTVTDIDTRVAILLLGGICTVYTVIGGIEAVVWTDVAQSIVLLGGALLSLVLILINVGGLDTFWHTAHSGDKLHMFNFTADASLAANAFWVIIVGNLFINLVPYTSDQAIIQRYMTTSDEASAKRAIWLNALLAVPSTALFFAIGTALYVYYSHHPQHLDPTTTNDSIFPAFIVQSLPPGIAGFVIAGIFAAAQSTVSGSMNSVATAYLTDFHWRLFQKGERLDDAAGVRQARLAMAAMGVLATIAALVLAEMRTASLWDAYNGLIGLTGSGLAGLFALGMFTRRANATGAIAGALASAVVLYLVQHYTSLHFFLHAAIGFLSCVIVGWLVSVLLPSARRTSISAPSGWPLASEKSH